MYTTAIKKFNLQPCECLVVEDNPVGILAGKASGANVLEVGTVYDVTYENIMHSIGDYKND